MSQNEQHLTPTIPTTNFIEAPLVHLIETDPAKLSPEDLQAYLIKLREFRGNPATRKAATEQKNKKPSAKGGIDLGGLL